MNLVIDLNRINYIRNRAKDEGFGLSFGGSIFTERFIYLLNDPEGDYSKERLKKLQDQLSLLVLLKKVNLHGKENIMKE